MTLFELLTLRPAFESATRAKLIDLVINEPPPQPRKYDPKIPRDLETIVLKAIAKEPAERYATAEALAADLENFLADKPIQARRSTAPERAWRWCRRNKAAAGLLAASAVAALALVGVVVGSIDNVRVRASERKAVTAQLEAEKQKQKAETAAESERRLGYFHRVVVAEHELTANNVGRAERLLDECPADLRDWEWNYMKRQCHTELKTIQAHQGTVRSLALSPNGRLIATAAQSDDTVRVWDAETRREVQTLPGHLSGVYAVAFSPDGTRVVSSGGSWNHPDRVLIREVATGETVGSFQLGTGLGSTVAFSPDGRRVVIASGEINRAGWVKVCDAQTGRERLTIPTGDGSSRVAASTARPGRSSSSGMRPWDAGCVRSPISNSGPARSRSVPTAAGSRPGSGASSRPGTGRQRRIRSHSKATPERSLASSTALTAGG
jgi:hypothetical protein